MSAQNEIGIEGARDLALAIIHATGGDPKRADEAASVIRAAALSAPPPVPEEVRRAFAEATDSPLYVHDFADPAVSPAPSCQDINLSFVTPDHITAAFMGKGLAGTIDQARKDATALAAAWNHYRTLLSAQPTKPTGEDAGARALAEIAYWRRDLAARLLFARAQHGPAMREGRHGEAFLHEQVMRGGIAALADADAGQWYEACEFCGEQILPGEATASDEENGGMAHARCAVDSPPPDGPPDDEAADLARQVELAREALAVEHPEVATPAPAPIPADGGLREAIEALVGLFDHNGLLRAPSDSRHAALKAARAALARPSAPGEGLREASPAEQAYGTLWRIQHDGAGYSQDARKLLMEAIGKDGQRRGIAWANEKYGPLGPDPRLMLSDEDRTEMGL